MNWKFWKKLAQISEPVFTLGEEILIYSNWCYEVKNDRNFLATHVLKHKEKDITLHFSIDMYECWQCREVYLTSDEVFYLGNKFKTWMMEHQFIKKQTEYLENQKERQRIAKELGL